jgi:lysozyme
MSKYIEDDIQNLKELVRNISENGVKLLCGLEGLRLIAYKDGGGVWTIGYGHTKTASKGMVITEKQAVVLLNRDLMDTVREVNNALQPHVLKAINQNQYDAIVLLVFNIGITLFNTSTIRRKLRRLDFSGAGLEFKRFKFDNGKVIKGLVNRRKAEEDLYFKVMS